MSSRENECNCVRNDLLMKLLHFSANFADNYSISKGRSTPVDYFKVNKGIPSTLKKNLPPEIPKTMNYREIPWLNKGKKKTKLLGLYFLQKKKTIYWYRIVQVFLI